MPKIFVSYKHRDEQVTQIPFVDNINHHIDLALNRQADLGSYKITKEFV